MSCIYSDLDYDFFLQLRAVQGLLVLRMNRAGRLVKNKGLRARGSRGILLILFCSFFFFFLGNLYLFTSIIIHTLIRKKQNLKKNIYIYILFHCRLLQNFVTKSQTRLSNFQLTSQNIEYSSLCYTVGPC